MFGIIAAFLFATAFVSSITVIAHMLSTYQEKMMAALAGRPMPARPRRPAVSTRRSAPHAAKPLPRGAARAPMAVAA